jgi:hypothetical protein
MLFGAQIRVPKTRHKRMDWNNYVSKTVANNTFQSRCHMTYPTFSRGQVDAIMDRYVTCAASMCKAERFISDDDNRVHK